MQSDFERKIKRVVLKIGASVITDKKGIMEEERIVQIADEVSLLKKKGIDFVLVTSGAIASGMQLLTMQCRPKDLSCLQATAALGQILLMRMYFDAFKQRGFLCAQVLLTWEDINDRRRYVNAKNTLLKLLEYGVIPVVNENDTVAVDEIKFGDNDRLSALVASILSADLLVIASDVDGLYAAGSKEVISQISDLKEEISVLARDTDKKHTSVGGMKTKLEAAKIAMTCGIPCVVANGKTPGVLSRVIQGEAVGTIFMQGPKALKAREHWLAFSTKPKGKIYVDDGAKEALINKGKSLLCPGITNVEGKFHSKDAVMILDQEGREFARGICEFSGAELSRLKGSRINKEVIHRDNLVVFKKD